MRGLIGFLGRLVMVAVAAILIGGGLAAPAAARSRDDGVQEANDMIEACVGMGGDPEVIEASDEWIIVSCKLRNGDNFQCDWSPGGDWSQHCHLFHSVPGGVSPIFEQVRPGPIDGVFVEEEPTPVTPQAMYDVVPIWTLFENDGGTEAPLRAAGGSSGRITLLSGSAVAPADDASGSRVTLGNSSTGPATGLVPAPAAEEILVPELAHDEVVTIQPVLAPVAEEIIVPELEEDDVVTIQPVPAPLAAPITVPELEENDVVTTQPVPAPVVEEIAVPELEEDEVVTTQPVPAPAAEEITVPEVEDDGVVTTQPVPAADEQP